MTPFKDTNRITSPYGPRKYTNSAGNLISEHHNGIDVVCTKYSGEPVSDGEWDFREVTGAVVEEVSYGYNYGRGNLVKTRTNAGAIQIYQHCLEIYVKEGDVVPQGTVLGRAGSTGNSTGIHLHFEVQINGVAVDPSPWLGLPNATGTYSGNDTLDDVPTLPDDEPEVIDAQLQRLCIIGDSETIKARAKELGLPVQTVTATLIGPASAGDAMELWGMSQTEGEEYFSRYTN